MSSITQNCCLGHCTICNSHHLSKNALYKHRSLKHSNKNATTTTTNIIPSSIISSPGVEQPSYASIAATPPPSFVTSGVTHRSVQSLVNTPSNNSIPITIISPAAGNLSTNEVVPTHHQQQEESNIKVHAVPCDGLHCNIHGTCFKTKGSFNSHMSEFHCPDSERTCPFCKCIFNSRKTLKLHKLKNKTGCFPQGFQVSDQDEIVEPMSMKTKFKFKGHLQCKNSLCIIPSCVKNSTCKKEEKEFNLIPGKLNVNRFLSPDWFNSKKNELVERLQLIEDGKMKLRKKGIVRAPKQTFVPYLGFVGKPFIVIISHFANDLIESNFNTYTVINLRLGKIEPRTVLHFSKAIKQIGDVIACHISVGPGLNFQLFMV